MINLKLGSLVGLEYILVMLVLFYFNLYNLAYWLQYLNKHTQLYSP